MSSRTLLIVAEDREAALVLSRTLHASDRDVRILTSPGEAIAHAATHPADLVVTQTTFTSPVSGLDVLRAFKAARPAVPVLVLSDTGSLDDAVQTLRAGATDYISAPAEPEALRIAVDRALDQGAALASLRSPEATATMLGRSSVMLDLYKTVAQAAAGAAPVLIVGESGTGKGLVARALHAHGARAARPFVSLNCAAMPDLLVESALFGHVRGAFPAATSDRVGLFVAARGGTLFLDNVTELSDALQARLLHALQNGEVRPLGAADAVSTDTRVVAAASSDLDRDIASRRFRQDLFFRLAVFHIRVPPLRDRPQDVPLLVEHFAHAASTRVGRDITLSTGAIARLRQLSWPGNVRELENVIERLVASARTHVVDAADIVLDGAPSPSAGAHPFADMPTLDELERRYLVYALQRFAGNRTRTAAALGIDRRTLYRMSARLGVPITGAEIQGANGAAGN